ncbi:hypothetical protein L8S15_21065 [Vibrio sp. S/42/10]|uniref:hypothetical protein n=1 Tax=Vibrio sp. S/42/10 TaxID=2914757 RepID=UPI0024699753|nr:hypothetical protein [Vibrio sp. S/42/10]MDH5881571.1 hypothetical protein [Vibrio sp. S/42/10]
MSTTPKFFTTRTARDSVIPLFYYLRSEERGIWNLPFISISISISISIFAAFRLLVTHTCTSIS